MAHEFTRNELVARILQKLRVLGEGDPATAEQESIANGIIDPGLGELQRTTGISINADFPMEIYWKENLASYLSYFCAADFAKVPDVAAKTYAETRLRAISSNGPTFEPLAIDPMFGGRVSPNSNGYYYDWFY